VDLGVDGSGARERCVMINNAGLIAGNGEGQNGTSGFVISNGKLKWLPGVGPKDTTVVEGITENGMIYGRSYVGGNARAAIWTNGVLRKMRAPFSSGKSYEDIWGMNSRGEIVGQGLMHRRGKTTRFVFWRSPNGKFRKFPSSLREVESLLVDEHGVLYGLAKRPKEAIAPTDEIAFRFENASVTYLSPELNALSEVSDRGFVAGSWKVDADGSQGCHWKDGKRFANSAHANGLNNLGDVVGDDVSYFSNDVSGASFWREETKVRLEKVVENLGDWQLSIASDINDKREIVGVGLKDGKSRFFLLEPVP
jgi:hypothetical protein